MHFSDISIRAYKSINKRVTLEIDPRMTVLVGANDHGKTNFLCAFDHLNAGMPLSTADLYRGYEAPEDAAGNLPAIRFGFRLTSEDLEYLHLEAANQSNDDPNDENETALRLQVLAGYANLIRNRSELTFNLSRTPNSGDLLMRPPSIIDGVDPEAAARMELQLHDYVLAKRPPVIFLQSPPNLHFKVPITTFNDGTMDHVLRGMIRIANAESYAHDLGQDTRTGQMARQDFNLSFNRAFPEFARDFGQFKDLVWHLELSDASQNVTLAVSDSTTRQESPLDKSLGTRSFLAYTLALYGHTGTKHPTGQVIVIDEPDNHLHPRGQKDLLGFFEDLAAENQIVYATHSPFMVPRRFPRRVRQVIRGADGSGLNPAPYRKSWATVIADLGVAASALFRYADTILLLEGSSDNLFLTILAEWFERGVDETLNLDEFAFRSAEGAGNAPYVVSAIQDEQYNIVVILDADENGTDAATVLRQRNYEKVLTATWAELLGDQVHTTEDLFPMSWIKAAAKALLADMAEQQPELSTHCTAATEKVEKMRRAPNIKARLAKVFCEEELIRGPGRFPSRFFADHIAKYAETDAAKMAEGEMAMVIQLWSKLKELIPGL